VTYEWDLDVSILTHIDKHTHIDIDIEECHVYANVLNRIEDSSALNAGGLA
jgi:hypothetical protein